MPHCGRYVDSQFHGFIVIKDKTDFTDHRFPVEFGLHKKEAALRSKVIFDGKARKRPDPCKNVF
jgi:hypothetical protein